MNPILTGARVRASVIVGLLLSGAFAAFADTLVTFQVDMSVAIANSTFNPLTQSVAARGSFSNWNPLPLTNNPAGLNPALYTGTTNVVGGNGTVMQYKYTIEPGASYEAVALGGSHNRLVTLPAGGGTLSTPVAYYGDTPPAPATVDVTFQVNMAQQINVGAFNPNTSLVYTRGSFNGWAADVAMTNDPSIKTTNQFGLVSSNVYLATYSVTGSPGQTTDFKFYFDPGANWESPGPGVGDPNDNNNRFFNLSATAQTNPIIYFNDAPYSPVATNAVTFQVDMTAHVLNGTFDPSTGTVEVRGNFNSWGTPVIACTNDPAAQNTNIYSAVVPITDGVGATEFYKFWATVPINTGWETMADNRSMKVVSGTAQTLPLVYFSNLTPGDLLPADTTVTFRVNMTNAVGTDAHSFDSSSDGVYINGIIINNNNYSFTSWDTFLPQLVNNPVGSQIYTLDVLIPKGCPVQLNYKYGINGVDDEAGANVNHVRYIRSVGTYVLPLDKFGNQLAENEPSFGNLKATASTAGHAMISWLGRPGVHLQTRASLSTGSWVDHPETDALSSTNWPTGGGTLFFRLIKPNVP